MGGKKDRWAVLYKNVGSAHQGVVFSTFNVALY